MQRLEVSGAIRLIYKSLGVNGLILSNFLFLFTMKYKNVMDNI